MVNTSFGQVIGVLGTGNGFPGNVSRIGERVISARPVLSTATKLAFGAGAVLNSTANGGNWQSLAEFLANPANAQNLQAYFAGVAVRNVKTMLDYVGLAQASAVSASTTGTASSGSTSLSVASATGVAVGQGVEGAGIQPNTITTAVSGTTVTLSLPTTAALSTTSVVFTSPFAPGVGYYAPGAMGEVLERGSISVLIANGIPQANAPVYIRTVANASLAGTFVGGFEAAADLATSSITITTTLGSTALTTSGATGLAIGQMITGPGIPNNTFLVSGSGTSWVMSQGAIAAVTGGAASFYNTALLGNSPSAPWIVFRTGSLDSNSIAEITIKERHAA